MIEYAEGLLEDIPAWMHEDEFTRRWFNTFGKELRRVQLMQEAIANAYTPARAGLEPEGWTEVFNGLAVPDDLTDWRYLKYADPTLINLTTNPRAGVDLTGIGAATNVVPSRITAGVPGGFDTGVESVGTGVAVTTGIIASYGRSGTGIGTGAHPVIGSRRYAVRGVAQIINISSGGITNLNLRVYWYTAAGASASVVSNTVQAQASPVVGTVYSFEGFATAPADAAFGVARFVDTQTNPSSWTIRTTGVAMYDALELITVPGYHEGGMAKTRWAGTAHASESEYYETWDLSVPSFLEIWERIVGLNEAPPNLTLQQRRDRVVAFRRQAKGQASGLAWEEAVTALIGTGWTYTEHIEGDVSTPNVHVVRVNLSVGSGTDEAEIAEKLLREITPAHIDLEINHGEGFQLGIDVLGTDVL